MLCVVLSLAACSNEKNFAPVMDLNPIEALPREGIHTVKAGETLYAIAWRYGLDYRVLATQNHIAPPYTIQSGQQIMLGVNTIPSETTSSSSVTPEPPLASEAMPTLPTGTPVWQWPVKGKVIMPYAALNKGINIAGREGGAILAASDGLVVYSGDGLRGYGNLLIIKHNHIFLSAYAHCRRLFVHEGQWVAKGQKIAEIGHSGTNKTMLHFEIRKAGKPLDPLTILP